MHSCGDRGCSLSPVLFPSPSFSFPFSPSHSSTPPLSVRIVARHGAEVCAFWHTRRWLRGTKLGQRPQLCVLIVNTDKVLHDRPALKRAGDCEHSVQSYGESGGGMRGGLCTESMLNLQRVLALSGAGLCRLAPKLP